MRSGVVVVCDSVLSDRCGREMMFVWAHVCGLEEETFSFRVGVWLMEMYF